MAALCVHSVKKELWKSEKHVPRVIIEWTWVKYYTY